MSAVAAEPDVLIARQGPAGLITLNRPKALNALTLPMVRDIARALAEWEHDPSVTRIVMQGAGGRAYCAGGDIRALYDLGRQGRIAEGKVFWREEYALNHRLKSYPKPVVSLIDGIVMGGGVGVSVHNTFRVATEKLVFAMPEVSIGFLPDVGATWLLPRLPHRIGSYLALTCTRVGLGDAMALGLATHAVESLRLPDVVAALLTDTPVEAALAAFGAPAAPTPILDQRALIADAFGQESVGAISARLEALAPTSRFAADALASLRKTSPTSLVLAHAALAHGATVEFAAALRMEYRIVCRISEGHDFYEGVRAVIVDKDQMPIWRPAEVGAVTDAAVAAHMAPLPDDLTLRG